MMYCNNLSNKDSEVNLLGNLSEKGTIDQLILSLASCKLAWLLKIMSHEIEKKKLALQNSNKANIMSPSFQRYQS